MSDKHISPFRAKQSTEPEPLDRLTLALSAKFARASHEETPLVASKALEDIAAALSTRANDMRRAPEAVIAELRQLADILGGALRRWHHEQGIRTRVEVKASQQHTWPGNVRELENVVERAMIASDGPVLRLDTPLAFAGTTASTVEMRAGAELLQDVERAHIAAMLERCGWRINGKGNAAERLGMHPNTLRFRLKKLGLSRPEN